MPPASGTVLGSYHSPATEAAVKAYVATRLKP